MNVVSYIRVSSNDQAVSGYSIPAQLERIRAYAFSQDWSLIHEYIDAGQSAGSMARPQMNQMLEDIKKDRMIKAIIVYRLDRLGRNIKDMLTLVARLQKRKVGVVSLTEHIDLTSATGRLLFNMLCSIAEYEREVTRERIIMGLEKKLEETGRMNGGIPFGYQADHQGNIVIVEREAIAVNRIFNLYLEHENYGRIAREIQEYYPGKNWVTNIVKRMLLNQKYIGTSVVHFNGKDSIHEDVYPVVIEKALFNRVQLLITRNKKERKKRLQKRLL